MSMRDMIMKKYISILNEIITDYDNTKTEKRGRKNKFDNVFYLKRISIKPQINLKKMNLQCVN